MIAKRILTTGAGGPAGINFIMSLKLAPEKLCLVSTESNKYRIHLAPTGKKYLVPPATSADYIEKLNEIIEKEKIEFLHPQPDIEVAVISANREKILANTFLPSKKAVLTCQNKYKSANRWKQKGIPVAEAMSIKDAEDVEEALERLGKPLWIRATRGAGGVGSTPASNKDTALAWIHYWRGRNRNWAFMAQEYLSGRNLAFHSLWKEGELVTSMSRERLEYIYPHLAPSGITGTPAVQRTIHDKRVNEIGTEAVLAIDPKFNGIACVDLKENGEGAPFVTEINAGRMFTTSYFFSFASKILNVDYYSNLPYLYVKLAYKETIPNLPKYDILPNNLYWIRHMDAPARLVKNGKVLGTMFT
ncbi:MAG TPA: ATP-grasp domain-containing protein [Candidatus Bathyarchaeia archaeon]|nr:ATP-grasp domain-containing protein [Candidatus Bathyarchaeia archaeon]